MVYTLWETPEEDSTIWQLLHTLSIKDIMVRSTLLIAQYNYFRTSKISKTLGRIWERYYRVACRQDVHVQRWRDTCASRDGPQRRRKAPMAQNNVGATMEELQQMSWVHSQPVIPEQIPANWGPLFHQVDRSLPYTTSGSNKGCLDPCEGSGEPVSWSFVTSFWPGTQLWVGRIC